MQILFLSIFVLSQSVSMSNHNDKMLYLQKKNMAARIGYQYIW